MKSPCAFMAFWFCPYKDLKQIYYNMRKQITLLCMMAFLSSLHVTAQSFRKYIDVKPELSASNGVAYPTPSGKLTAPPVGYVPVYISHYGRHGSRYLLSGQDYIRPLQVLERADSAGVLNEKGRETMGKIRRMYAESYKRWGELTPLGAEQHKQIARRMFKRFPSVFRDSVWVDAKSTVVIRCILSMENALQELLRQNPHLRIRHDASEHDMYYMNFSDKKLAQQKESEEVKETMKDWEKRNMNYQPLMSRLFKNADYVDKNINAEQLTTDLFSLAGFVQNSEIRHSLSLYDILRQMNVIVFGSAPMFGGIYTLQVHLRVVLNSLSLSVIFCVILSLKQILVLRFLIQELHFVSDMKRWLCRWLAYLI